MRATSGLLTTDMRRKIQEKWERPDPFNLHDWSVVENGKITSYGTNRRYIESFGYTCSMSTDSEIITYLIDLLVGVTVLRSTSPSGRSPPLSGGYRPDAKAERDLNRAIRLAYGSAAMNGPFTVVVANPDMMVGFTDRSKLRPMVVGECGDRLVYIERRGSDPGSGAECLSRSPCRLQEGR